ncbi:hypothetical protein AX16_004466 [Volvariella volvacea WC 439]|nr:hypothetical protein AX16_004466 [Volvariella volvacea WC 439]
MISHLIIGAILSFPLLYFTRRWKWHRFPHPPGPKGKFLIGNIFNFPKSYQWRTFFEWTKTYDSDILYLNLAGHGLVVLNSFSVTKELLERRSAIYSSRPKSTMVMDLMGWDFAMVFMEYGPTWREHRKFMYQSFNPITVTKFKPHITKATHTLMRNLLNKPDEYTYFVRHMTAEVILLITYGIQVLPENDPYVNIVERAASTAASATLHGSFIVDFFPWLKYVPEWFPFAQFQRLAKEWKTYTMEMVDTPYNAVRDDILAGKGIKSLVADGLCARGDKESSAEWEDIVKRVAGLMYAAGSDTTVAAIVTGILAFMCHPDVLKKAQAEIDSTVAPGHLPDLSDKESLPYLSAIVKEILRWNPPLPFGVPHFIESDDIYDGYHIPAGTIVLSNIWGMLHDENLYADPFTFDPERFLKNGKLNPEVHDPETMVFGFGRRQVYFYCVNVDLP